MVTESLNELKAAFRVWRSQKRYSREAIPPELLSRARQAVAIHGISAVVNATNFTRNGLPVKELTSTLRSVGRELLLRERISNLRRNHDCDPE